MASLLAVQCALLIAPYDCPDVMAGTVLVPPPIRRGEGQGQERHQG